ncbi:conserved protein of unknown function [Limnospira indica PCC 8005]|uniref:Uncharacterized protein n=1 Tax=Limnospira indica PCC 8005 TaxID=376219 RepID=A0A9P1KAU0_9CYAN|nr:conserved protein of unknown function [Limnospira indica PCC 8005]
MRVTAVATPNLRIHTLRLKRGTEGVMEKPISYSTTANYL